MAKITRNHGRAYKDLAKDEVISISNLLLDGTEKLEIHKIVNCCKKAVTKIERLHTLLGMVPKVKTA
jgi:hypothetical protein